MAHDPQRIGIELIALGLFEAEYGISRSTIRASSQVRWMLDPDKEDSLSVEDFGGLPPKVREAYRETARKLWKISQVINTERLTDDMSHYSLTRKLAQRDLKKGWEPPEPTLSRAEARQDQEDRKVRA